MLLCEKRGPMIHVFRYVSIFEVNYIMTERIETFCLKNISADYCTMNVSKMVSDIFSIISWMEPRETQLKDFQWADTWSRWGMKLLQVGGYSDNPGRDRWREEGQHQGDKCVVRFRWMPENRSWRQKLMCWDNDRLKQQAGNRNKHHVSGRHAPRAASKADSCGCLDA